MQITTTRRKSASAVELRRFTISHLSNTRVSNYDCRICNLDHPLRKCVKFKRMTVPERIKVVRRFKYCENCLAHSHLLQKCHNINCCRQCGENHHTLLHRRRMDTHIRPCRIGSVTVIPTILAKIKIQDTWNPVRGILNPCAEFSSIASFLVKRYKPPVVVIDGVEWWTFSFQSHFEEGPLFRVTAKVSKDLPTLLNRRKLDDSVADNFQNLRLADPHFFLNGEINVVLGADIYPQLVRQGIQPQSFGSAMAQDTKLGWTIIGKFAD